ncbi:hypothetical protein TNCV_4082201 [Trichonephila clavipes]|nr:hypothetical protein TNCV_4082201 [Trichonephila clavipes]
MFALGPTFYWAVDGIIAWHRFFFTATIGILRKLKPKGRYEGLRGVIDKYPRVNEDDIEELIMGHEDELTIELQEILNKEHQETQ